MQIKCQIGEKSNFHIVNEVSQRFHQAAQRDLYVGSFLGLRSVVRGAGPLRSSRGELPWTPVSGQGRRGRQGVVGGSFLGLRSVVRGAGAVEE